MEHRTIKRDTHRIQRLLGGGAGNSGVLAKAGRLVRTSGCAIAWISYSASGPTHYMLDLFLTGEPEHAQALHDRAAKAGLIGRHGSVHSPAIFVHRSLQHHLHTYELTGINHPRLVEDIANLCDIHGLLIAHLEGHRTVLPPADYADGWAMMLVIDDGGNPRRHRLADLALRRYGDQRGLLVQPVKRYAVQGTAGLLLSLEAGPRARRRPRSPQPCRIDAA